MQDFKLPANNGEVASTPAASTNCLAVEVSCLSWLGIHVEKQLRQEIFALAVDIPHVIDFVNEKQFLPFIDLENDPYLARPYPQKTLPLAL